jgi:hypothetical protein
MPVAADCRNCKSNCDTFNGEFIWSTGAADYSCRVQVQLQLLAALLAVLLP